MALDKATLKTAIKGIITDMRTREQNADDEFADRLANAIDAFVKTGQVPAGVPFNGSSSVGAVSGTTTAAINIV